MSGPDDPRAPASTADAFIRFRAQADELYANLVRLRQELANVLREVDGTRAMQLLETNEKLVLAALRAEAIAETAISNLNDVTRASQRDPLTHTANRSLMFRCLASAMADARRKKTRIAVLFLDLDHFRHINNALGHTGGDEVLKLVARRLESVLRDTDTVSRHGGDEFLILLGEISQPSDAALVARHLLAAIAEPCTIGGAMLRLSASIGIAIYPDDGEEMDTLIDRADIAMYRSKRIVHGEFLFHGDTRGATESHPVQACSMRRRLFANRRSGVSVICAKPIKIWSWRRSTLKSWKRTPRKHIASKSGSWPWWSMSYAIH